MYYNKRPIYFAETYLILFIAVVIVIFVDLSIVVCTLWKETYAL